MLSIASFFHVFVSKYLQQNLILLIISSRYKLQQNGLSDVWNLDAKLAVFESNRVLRNNFERQSSITSSYSMIEINPNKIETVKSDGYIKVSVYFQQFCLVGLN